MRGSVLCQASGVPGTSNESKCQACLGPVEFMATFKIKTRIGSKWETVYTCQTPGVFQKELQERGLDTEPSRAANPDIRYFAGNDRLNEDLFRKLFQEL